MADRNAQSILIVDDVPENVQILAETLGNSYDIRFALSGEQALEMLETDVVDLILLDIGLPGIDGFEVCQIVRLKPEWQGTKIIFLTAKGRDVDIARGMVLGADAYVTKPFSNADIVAKVRELLNDRA